MQKPARYTSQRRIGDLKHSLRPDDHDGWIKLDGRTIKRADFPKLFSVLNLTGATWTLPVQDGAAVVGAGQRYALGKVGGSNELQLTIENIPAHDHSYTDTYAEPQANKGGLLAGIVNVMSGLVSKTTDKRTGSTGGGKPIANNPLGIGANLFIYTGRVDL